MALDSVAHLVGVSPGNQKVVGYIPGLRARAWVVGLIPSPGAYDPQSR